MFGRNLIFALLLTCLSLVVSAPVPAAEQPDDADLLKAAFVYKFTKYVRWPETVRTESFNLCLLGEGKVNQALHYLQGDTVRGQNVAIRTLTLQDTPSDCHMLYIGDLPQGDLTEQLASLGGQPVLTVSDTPDFAEKGGIIGLYWQNKKIRFAVNIGAARQADLMISSRLLSLARIVNDEGAQ